MARWNRSSGQRCSPPAGNKKSPGQLPAGDRYLELLVRSRRSQLGGRYLELLA
jgi:hypothetical protein